MRKIAFLLTLDMLLSLFTGCDSSEPTRQPAGESEEILYCPAPMTEEIYHQLFPLATGDWDPSKFWSEANSITYVYRFYGNYNGYHILAERGRIATSKTYTVAGYEFTGQALILTARKGSQSKDLDKAYDSGWLTKEDIETIYDYHKLTEPLYYPSESGE